MQTAVTELRELVVNELEALRETLLEQISSLENIVSESLTSDSDPDVSKLETRFQHACSLRSDQGRARLKALDQSLGAAEQRLWDLVAGTLNKRKSPQPTEFVQRLRRFLTSSKDVHPSLTDAHRQYAMAESVLRTLDSQLKSPVDDLDDVARAIRADLRREAEDLAPIVDELRSLVLSIESGTSDRHAPRPARDESQDRNKKNGAVPAQSGDGSEVRTGQQPTKPDQPPTVPEQAQFHPLSPEDIRVYEEDYFRQGEICQILRQTAVTDPQLAELAALQRKLDARREAIARWRREGGYTGVKPWLFAETFKGAMPGESPVKGKKKSKTKAARKKGQSQDTQNPKKRKARKQTKKRSRRNSGVPFAVWAADSWGKDPDPLPREPNVVLGGAMESNRGRH